MRWKKDDVMAVCAFFLFTMVYIAVPSHAASMSGFESKVTEVYNTIRNVAASMAAVGLAICGMTFLLGGSKAAEKSKATMLYIIYAFIGILLLPAIVKGGKMLFG